MSCCNTVEELARGIRLLVLDVDGVMTDGGLYFDETGLRIKRFQVTDGIGIRLAFDAGIEVAVISGMDVECVRRRLETLGVREYHGGFDNKRVILDRMRTRLGVEWQEIAYLGDDWVDLAPMSCVGLPIAVANAAEEVKSIARYVTTHRGGEGAVREVVDLLLACQGKRDELFQRWLHLGE